MEIFRRRKLEQPLRGTQNNENGDVQSPYAEAVIAAFDRHFGSEVTAERRAMAREIVQTFFHETLQNARLHKSDKHGVSYPWGVMNTGAVAKKLYASITGKEIGPLQKNDKEVKRKEFIFGSLLFRMHGTPFMYQEEALHQLIKGLPSAMEAIARGEEPESIEVYTLGSPTNLLGTMSDKFSKKVRDEGAFDAFGELYAEHIQSILSKDDGADTKARLYGQSLGGAIAVEVANDLLASGVVTQDKGDARPKLQVRIEAPPASNHTPPGIKAVQTSIGFGVDSAFAPKRDPYVKAVWGAERKFVDDVNKVLAERGMPVNDSPEQTKMKRAGLRSLVGNLLKGKSIPKDMNVTEIVGLYDPLMFSPVFEGKAIYQRATRERSLQRYLVAEEGAGGGRKRYGIAMAHVPPFYRDNELRRLNRAALYLERAKAGVTEARQTH